MHTLTTATVAHQILCMGSFCKCKYTKWVLIWGKLGGRHRLEHDANKGRDPSKTTGGDGYDAYSGVRHAACSKGETAAGHTGKGLPKTS